MKLIPNFGYGLIVIGWPRRSHYHPTVLIIPTSWFNVRNLCNFLYPNKARNSALFYRGFWKAGTMGWNSS